MNSAWRFHFLNLYIIIRISFQMVRCQYHFIRNIFCLFLANCFSYHALFQHLAFLIQDLFFFRFLAVIILLISFPSRFSSCFWYSSQWSHGFYATSSLHFYLHMNSITVTALDYKVLCIVINFLLFYYLLHSFTL